MNDKGKSMSIGIKNFSPEKLQAKIDEAGYNKSRFVVRLNQIASTPRNRLLRLFPNARHLNRHLQNESVPTLDYVRLYCKALNCSMKDLLNG
jgi:diketogulonate reductase-like aldo/keto reductase